MSKGPWKNHRGGTRDGNINIRLSITEKQQAKDMAALHQCSESDLVRMLIRNKAIQLGIIAE